MNLNQTFISYGSGMKKRQFIILLTVILVGFGIIIAIIEGTNSTVPDIINTNNKVGEILVKIESIERRLDDISTRTAKINNIEEYVHKIYNDM